MAVEDAEIVALIDNELDKNARTRLLMRLATDEAQPELVAKDAAQQASKVFPAKDVVRQVDVARLVLAASRHRPCLRHEVCQPDLNRHRASALYCPSLPATLPARS